MIVRFFLLNSANKYTGGHFIDIMIHYLKIALVSNFINVSIEYVKVVLSVESEFAKPRSKLRKVFQLLLFRLS